MYNSELCLYFLEITRVLPRLALEELAEMSGIVEI